MTETATTRAEYEQPQTDPLNPNADPDANPEDTLPDWQRRLLELREELQVLEEQQALGIDPSAPSQATGSATGAAPGAPSPTGVTLPEGFELPDPMQRRGGRANEPGDTLIPRREAYRLDPSTLQLIRDSGDTVETFIPSGGGVRNPYAEHMAAGQRLMQAGRYFDAEERFTTAVSVREDDPMAQIGRVHAQLGAAMFLSAGVNLRTYLLQRPEAAGLRYDAPLLPLPERQAVLAELLLEKSDANASIAREASLLLTYMGYQARNDEWLSRGLERMQQHWDGEPILDFVTGVWGLTPPVPQSDPQPE